MSALALGDAVAVVVERHMRTSPSCTWIYFVQAGEGGPIKIGESDDPLRRVARMRVDNHAPLHLLVVARVVRGQERYEHEDLSAARLHGEWFAPTAEVLEVVARYESKGHRAWLEAAA